MNTFTRREEENFVLLGFLSFHSTHTVNTAQQIFPPFQKESINSIRRFRAKSWCQASSTAVYFALFLALNLLHDALSRDKNFLISRFIRELSL